MLSCLEAKPVDDPFIIAETREIKFSVHYERENAVRWRDLHKSSANGTKTLRRLVLGAGSQFMQQFGGINIMSYYLPTVLIQVRLIMKPSSALVSRRTKSFMEAYNHF